MQDLLCWLESLILSTVNADILLVRVTLQELAEIGLSSSLFINRAQNHDHILAKVYVMVPIESLVTI